MPELVDLIQERVRSVKEAMSLAAMKAGRTAERTRLLVVTKKQSLETIQAAIDAGLTSFGENYPEESATKIAYFKDNRELHWEMIGHIQSRKANLVADGFDLIHSIDSLKLATKLNRLREASVVSQQVLIEVNIAAEANKSGYLVDSENAKSLFYSEFEAIAELEHLKIRGFMGMPPLQENPDHNRRYFSELRVLLETVNQKFGLTLSELSMGTSSDFQVAIEEGATVIRIGEAILGKRK